MSGKIMQKSLVLGALMSFVITGNVWAAGHPVYNNASTTGSAIAIGAGSVAKDDVATDSAVAIGALSNAGQEAVAIGRSSNASGQEAVAIGQVATASSLKSVAVGYGSGAIGVTSIAIGQASKANGEQNIAMGYQAETGTTKGTIAIGALAKATGESDTAIGRGTQATGGYSTAYGPNAYATGYRSTALGYSANASGAGDLAIGSHAITEAVTSVNTAIIGGITYNVAGNDGDGFIAAASFGGGESSSLTGGEPIYRQLQKVAAGQVSATSTDAVNGSQLYAAYQAVDNLTTETNAAVAGLNHRLDRTNTRLDKVGAGAAALAALHPLEYDPDDKLTFSVGMGNYSGENAAALGAFYRPDEKLMFSLGGTMGNGENMVNVGVSIGLDKPNGFAKMSKRELIQEVTAVKAENEAMKAEMVEMKAMLQKLLAKN
jgi:autotransporter adhesin